MPNATEIRLCFKIFMSFHRLYVDYGCQQIIVIIIQNAIQGNWPYFFLRIKLGSVLFIIWGQSSGHIFYDKREFVFNTLFSFLPN